MFSLIYIHEHYRRDIIDCLVPAQSAHCHFKATTRQDSRFSYNILYVTKQTLIFSDGTSNHSIRLVIIGQTLQLQETHSLFMGMVYSLPVLNLMKLI